MELTVKQQRFCEEYLISGNATEAAVKAGYSPNTARVIASENLTKPAVVKFLKAKTEEISGKNIAQASEVLEYLSETMRSKDEPRRERTKAAELLGKRYGLWADKGKDGEERMAEALKSMIEAFGNGKRE